MKTLKWIMAILMSIFFAVTFMAELLAIWVNSGQWAATGGLMFVGSFIFGIILLALNT